MFSTLLVVSASVAQVQRGQVKPGQVIFFNYLGERTEAKVISEDSSGIKIEAKNPLTKQYDGSNTRYILPADVMTLQPGGGGGGVSQGGGTPALTPTSSTNSGAAQSNPQSSLPQQGGGGGTPRTGRYHMYGFPSSSSRMFLVGWFDLMPGGAYKTKAGGTGTYSVDGTGIQWLSGPFKSEGHLGIVRIERGGLTSRITLTKTAGGNDRMVAFCSAGK